MQLRCPHCNKLNRIDEQRLADHPSCGACTKALLAGVIVVDSQSLRDLIAQQALPVLVDFWAPWCGPCQQFAPTYEAAAKKHANTLIFAKLDTEANKAASSQFNIRSIPTLAAFHRSAELGRVSGALPPAQLEGLINGVIQTAA